MKFTKLIFCFLLLSIFFSCKSDKKKQQVQTVPETEETAKTAPENLYNGWDDKILERLAVDEIPNDFPRYKTGESDEEYKRRCYLWAKKNIKLLKPKYREKAENFEAKN